MFQKALELQSQQIFSVFVTVTNAKGSTPREIGAKMLVTAKDVFGSIGGGTLEWLAIAKAREIIGVTDESQGTQKMSVPLCSKAQQCCGGFVELFFDVLKPKPKLTIFGAGHVGQALLEVLAGTAFDCTLVDERSEWIQAASDKKLVFTDLSLHTVKENPLQWLREQPSFGGPLSFAVVMTHDHQLDQDLIEILCQKPLAYLGLIGSKTKRHRFTERLLQKGRSESEMGALHCPMGLPIGGKAPKEVSISLAAQLVQTFHHLAKGQSVESQKVIFEIEEAEEISPDLSL